MKQQVEALVQTGPVWHLSIYYLYPSYVSIFSVYTRSKFLLDPVIVSLGRISRDQLPQESREEQERSHDHHGERDIKIGRFGDQAIGIAMLHVMQLDGPHQDNGDQSQHEHHAPP